MKRSQSSKSHKEKRQTQKAIQSVSTSLPAAAASSTSAVTAGFYVNAFFFLKSCVTNKTLKRERKKKRESSTRSTDLIFIRWGFESLQQTSSEGKWELLPLQEKRDGGGHQEGEIMENLCSLRESLLAGFNSLNSGKISAGNTRALTCPAVWKPDVGWRRGESNRCIINERRPLAVDGRNCS